LKPALTCGYVDRPDGLTRARAARYGAVPDQFPNIVCDLECVGHASPGLPRAIVRAPKPLPTTNVSTVDTLSDAAASSRKMVTDPVCRLDSLVAPLFLSGIASIRHGVARPGVDDHSKIVYNTCGRAHPQRGRRPRLAGVAHRYGV